ncbi:MAG TPA: DUF1330 domain-containing protein [Rugosimonospora sp.]|nr:DUF1330 domain-containing protein [Rugosimonospora sp.]
MSAFYLFEMRKVVDGESLERYRSQVPEIVARYGGQYRIIGGNPATVEGDWSPGFLIMLEFPTVEQAKSWYGSPEYEPWKRLRLDSVEGTGVFVEGI